MVLRKGCSLRGVVSEATFRASLLLASFGSGFGVRKRSLSTYLPINLIFRFLSLEAFGQLLFEFRVWPQYVVVFIEYPSRKPFAFLLDGLRYSVPE